MGYWENRRRREKEKGKPVILSKETRIEFRIDEQFYVYIWRSSAAAGEAQILKGNEVIYGSFESTEEGRKVYDLLKTENKI